MNENVYNNRRLVTLITNRRDKLCLYETDEFRIGGGAMGVVYKGWYANNPEYKVAIKKVHNNHSNNINIRRRAKHESALSVDHPNIIKMLGYAESEPDKGPIYIISEYLRGVTINEYMSEVPQKLRVKRLSEIMCSLLDGLDALHNLPVPVYHRDIKPSNIMIENGGNARLIDLGIATSDGVSHGTLDGFAGTAAFTSPEQISSSKYGNVGARSDIYSLGVSFYTLLTDTNPFSDGIVSEIEVLNRQITQILPEHHAVARPLMKVLRKATAKNANDRYQTARAFKNAIIESQRPLSIATGIFSNDKDLFLFTMLIIGALVSLYIVMILFFI